MFGPRLKPKFDSLERLTKSWTKVEADFKDHGGPSVHLSISWLHEQELQTSVPFAYEN